MKAPVLVVAATTGARAIRAALADELALTVTDDPEQARALVSTGAFVAVLSVGSVDGFAGAVEIDASASPAMILDAVNTEIERAVAEERERAAADEVGAIPYDNYVELARYAFTRRYLTALLSRHGGSVTDAARGANLKRESLHRLMRRHHVIADDFRKR